MCQRQQQQEQQWQPSCLHLVAISTAGDGVPHPACPTQRRERRNAPSLMRFSDTASFTGFDQAIELFETKPVTLLLAPFCGRPAAPKIGGHLTPQTPTPAGWCAARASARRTAMLIPTGLCETGTRSWCGSGGRQRLFVLRVSPRNTSSVGERFEIRNCQHIRICPYSYSYQVCHFTEIPAPGTLLFRLHQV